MSKIIEKPTLSEIYESETIHDIVRQSLKEEFNASFERIIKEITGAFKFEWIRDLKDNIEQLVIEYGIKFESTKDLYRILDIIDSSKINEGVESI